MYLLLDKISKSQLKKDNLDKPQKLAWGQTYFLTGANGEDLPHV